MSPMEAEIVKTMSSKKVPEHALLEALDILNGKKMIAKAGNGYMAIKDACKYLGGVSRTYLWSARKNGLKFYQIGSRVVFKSMDLDEYIEKCN